MNGIWSDLRKLLKYFNGTKIVAFLKTPFAASASVLYNNVALCSEDVMLLLLGISALKLVFSSFK